MQYSKYIFLLLFPVLVLVSCSKKDPEAIITILDEENRPIPNAKVMLFSRPTNIILEDIQFTNEEGQSFHKFAFESTLDVIVDVINYSIYENLTGEGEIILTRGDVYETTIILHEPIIEEE